MSSPSPSNLPAHHQDPAGRWWQTREASPGGAAGRGAQWRRPDGVNLLIFEYSEADPSESGQFHTPESDALGFRDLYETLLNKLRRPRHGIGVDLYSGNEVCISPTVDLGCSAAELDLHTSFHQVCNQLLVWVASGNIAVGVVRLVM